MYSYMPFIFGKPDLGIAFGGGAGYIITFNEGLGFYGEFGGWYDINLTFLWFFRKIMKDLFGESP